MGNKFRGLAWRDHKDRARRMLQQTFCRTAKELMLGLIYAMRTEHQTIDVVLPYELLDCHHWTTCHYYRLIEHLAAKLSLTEGLEELVRFRFQVLLQFGKRCVRVVNAGKVRQVVNHVYHI